MIARPFNLQAWIAEHRHLLKPPVGNQQIYKGNEDFVVMVVGGPNSRTDYHYNQGEELFYQLEGDITLKLIEDGKPVDVPIKAGEMFLLPPRVPHSPQRGANTIGLVIERYHDPSEEDGFMWFCENCGHKLHEAFVPVSDIVGQLPIILASFRDNPALHVCSQCGTIAKG